jgi:uncharacterized protein with von Willebrand factor type A (vWA) domain
MVDYKKIHQIGIKLQQSDVKTISTDKLYQLLRKATNCHRANTLKHYMSILRDDGFIRMNQHGQWEIIKN